MHCQSNIPGQHSIVRPITDYENMIHAQQNNTLATSLQQKETRLKIQIAVISPTEVDELDKLED